MCSKNRSIRRTTAGRSVGSVSSVPTTPGRFHFSGVGRPAVGSVSSQLKQFLETNTQVTRTQLQNGPKSTYRPKENPQRRRTRAQQAPRMFEKHTHRSTNGAHRLKGKGDDNGPCTNHALTMLVRCHRAVSSCGPKNARNNCVNCGRGSDPSTTRCRHTTETAPGDILHLSA